jgi:hypothetical protein
VDNLAYLVDLEVTAVDEKEKFAIAVAVVADCQAEHLTQMKQEVAHFDSEVVKTVPVGVGMALIDLGVRLRMTIQELANLRNTWSQYCDSWMSVK